MGLIRVLLALAVVVSHVGTPLFGLDFFGEGATAVQTFYVLSGFYMALVLTTRYRDHWKEFYFNRFLRLFPAYWMLAGFILAAGGAGWIVLGHPLGPLADLRTQHPAWWVDLWALASNLLIVGSDWAQFASRLTNYHFNVLVMVPQVWTVAVEICFYLLAPRLLRARLGTQVAILLGGILLRRGLYALGGGWSFWLYSFAPSSIPFFLAGVLSYRLLAFLEGRRWFVRTAAPAGWLLGLGLGALICTYRSAGLFGFDDWRYYAFVALALPFVFTAFKDVRADAMLAAWSYPIYLAHSVIVDLYAPLRHFVPPSGKIYAVVALTIALSALVLHFDRKVQRRFKRPV